MPTNNTHTFPKTAKNTYLVRFLDLGTVDFVDKKDGLGSVICAYLRERGFKDEYVGSYGPGELV